MAYKDEDAKQIALLIANTNVDDRGNLLDKVSDYLKISGQGYTGELMRTAAVEYGINSG